MFIRTKRVKKNGKVYIYRYGQKSVWAAGRVHSIHLGRADEEHERAMERALHSAERQAREIDEWQRKTYGETAAERSAREAKEREWTQEKFLADPTVQEEEVTTAQQDEGALAENTPSENDPTDA